MIRPTERSRSRLWLALGVLVVNLAIAGLALFSLHEHYTVHRQEARDSAAGLADQLQRRLGDQALQVDAVLRGVVDDFDEVERRPAHGVSLVSAQRLARHQQRLPEGCRLYVTDYLGQVTLAPGLDPRRPVGLGDRDYFIRARSDRNDRNDRGGALQVGVPVLDRVSATWIVPFARALRSADGGFGGVVVASVPVDLLAALLRDLGVGPKGLALLRDADLGVVAMHPPVPPPHGAIGSRAITPQARAMLDTGADKGSYDAPTSPDGVARTYAFHWSRPMRMVVGVGLAPHDYLAGWRLEVAAMSALVALTALVTGIGAWRIDRAWTRLAADIALRHRREQELRDSERRYALLVNSSPDWVWESDAAGLCRFSSERGRALLGLEPQDAVGRPLRQLLPAADAVQEHPLDTLGRDGRGFSGVVFAFGHHDGTRRVLELSGTPVLDEGGGFVGLRGTGRDVTARHEAELARRRSEALFAAAFQASPEAVSIVSMVRRCFVDVNEAFLRVTGYRRDELIGRTSDDLDLWVDIADRDRFLGELLAHGAVRDREFAFRVKSGEARDCLVASELVDLDGERCSLNYMVDITERKRAQAAIARSEAKYRQLYENANDAIFILENGAIADCNAQAEALLRRPREQILGRDISAVSPDLQPDGQRSTEAAAARVAQAMRGEPCRFEWRGRRADGSIFDIDVMLTRVDYDGVPRLLSMVRDITERKRIEGELQAHRSALERLVDERTADLRLAMEAAEAASRAKSAFLANMSHEIRTPLNVMSGMAHLIGRGPLAAEQRDRLAKLQAAGEHLIGVIDAILELSKIDAGRVTLDDAPVDVARLCDSVVALQQERAAARRLTLQARVAPLGTGLRGDGTRLQQALLNLVGNAIKFTEQGTVLVQVRPEHEDADGVTLRFEVADTGIGIAPQDLARLFVAFEQVDPSSTRRQGGTGLGLAITRRLARLMGGDAGAESTPGVGSRFWFTARLARGAAPDARPGPSGTWQQHEEELRRRHAGRRVLLAEDEPIGREVAMALLEAAGQAVTTAADGHEALECLDAQAFDLVLMDMQMPGIDGLEATRRARERPALQRLPIVAMTANAFAEDRQRCLEAGMNDFLSKPVDPAQLYAVLLRWYGAAQAA